MTTKFPTKETGFKLITGDPEGSDMVNLEEPKAVVRWCLTPELATELKADGVLHKVMVLITVVLDRGEDEYYDRYVETTRYLSPVTQEMETVFFSASGENTVHAMLVWPQSGGGDLHKKLLRRRRGATRYEESLVYRNGDLIDASELNRWSIGCIDTVVSKEFSIGADFFPSPPGGLAKAVLDKWGQGNPFDQCDTRGKLMWTIPLTLITLPFAYLFKLVIGLFAILFLVRKGYWGSCLHPLERGSTWDFLESFDSSAWFYKKPKAGQWHVKRNIFMWVLNPYTVVFFGSVLFLMSHITVHVTGSETETTQWFFIGYWEALAVVAIIQIAAAVGVAITLAVWMLIGVFASIDYSNTTVGKWRTKRHQVRVTQKAKVAEQMLCDVMPHEASYDMLDTSGKTTKEKVHLLKSRIKSTKACTPYSRY